VKEIIKKSLYCKKNLKSGRRVLLHVGRNIFSESGRKFSLKSVCMRVSMSCVCMRVSRDSVESYSQNSVKLGIVSGEL